MNSIGSYVENGVVWYGIFSYHFHPYLHYRCLRKFSVNPIELQLREKHALLQL
jgi:hypothetical protein